MAIGIRYDPPANAAPHKKPLELTLEYGPQRMGAMLMEESVPILLLQDHLSWENEGKVYFTTASIESLQWKSAYYMASLTGAVLNKVLERAVAYTTSKPRYQPFLVVDDSSEGRILIKSSSSADFVRQMWSELANLGVDLRPILTPPTYTPRLHVISASVQKVSGYDDAGLLIMQEASVFFDRFSNCWSAIATGDYSHYQPISEIPSTAPSSITPSSIPSMEPSTSEPSSTLRPTLAPSFARAPTASPTSNLTDKAAKMTQTDESGKNNGDTNSDTSEQAGNGDSPSAPNNIVIDYDDDNVSDFPSNNTEMSNGDNRIRRRVIWSWSDILSESSRMSGESPEETLDQVDTDDAFLSALSEMNISTESPSSPDQSFNTTFPPSSAPTHVDTASKAQQAAQEAKEAAQQAKNASSHEAAEQAANAAEHAADAAQKAADAARWEKDMANILSGDGELVTQALKKCWTDPRYGLTSENSTVVAYMYLDGNFFYRMNLTEPYLDVVRLDVTLPHPFSSSSITYDDFVDWTLAFFVMGLCLLGVLALVQQAGLRLGFYRLQKNFFNPTHQIHHDDEVRNAMDDYSDYKGRGHEHGFGEDAIPLSMGGRRPEVLRKPELWISSSPRSKRLSRDVNDFEGDLELATIGQEGNGEDAPPSQIPPLRFTRDPDFVDMPNLTSNTRVARPVTISSLTDRSDSMDDTY
jgi:hypothetical protein